MTGKVKFWNAEKGWGFLSAGGTQDIFCHYSDIQMHGRKNLKEGDAVDFDIESAPKGPRAKNVKMMQGDK